MCSHVRVHMYAPKVTFLPLYPYIEDKGSHQHITAINIIMKEFFCLANYAMASMENALLSVLLVNIIYFII